MDIRQSKQYANFMKSLGWKVEHIGKWQAFIKHFPLIGSFIKIQRIGKSVSFDEIRQLVKKHHAYRLIIEPDRNTKLVTRNLKLGTASPYSPSKTIHIDLTLSEETIFDRFSPTTRRAIRRAMKNNVVVTESEDIESFIKLKTRYYFPLGFLMESQIRKLWSSFHPKDAVVLLAYKTVVPISNRLEKKPHAMRHYNHNLLGGILLLFHQTTAYYWHATATDEGKKLFAPTLLVWEALKHAKKRGCKTFDFEGIYDERFPKETRSWKGFTRFKSGFGGREVEYPKPVSLN